MLRVIGALNRTLLRGRIRNIFLLYPAHPKYASAYVYDWHRRMIKWRPALVGCYLQNGQLGLTFGISATEEDYRATGNHSTLGKLEHRMESLRTLIGAETKTYAGILPSVLDKYGHRSGSPHEKRNTISMVEAGLSVVVESQCLPRDTTVIVLGGNGYIGSDLIRNNPARNWVSVDLQDFDRFPEIVANHSSRPAIVLNLTKRDALRDYIPQFWKGCIVVNEVYPEPSKQELETMRQQGVLCYHIAGARAKAWPSFPRAYQGGIPCCAAIDANSAEVILKLLT